MSKVTFKYILLVVFVGINFFSHSQSKHYNNGVSVTYHYGFLMPHHTYMQYLNQQHTKHLELNYYLNTNLSKSWHQYYNKPTIGIGFKQLELSSKKELGNGFGLFPFIDFPLNKGEKIKLKFKFAYGLGYIEKYFNKTDNYKNMAIGSGFNAFIYLNQHLDFKISERITSSVGLSFTHFSNGAFKTPNLGINVPAINIGMSYNFNEKEVNQDIIFEDKEKLWSTLIIGNIGSKQIYPPQGDNYFISSFSLNQLKTITNKSKLGGGFDVFYNSSLPDQMQGDSVMLKNNLNTLQSGVSLVYCLSVGKVDYYFNFGGYFFTRYKEEGILYHRIGSRYYLNDNMFIHLGLKTHFAKADFVELGLGLKIK